MGGPVAGKTFVIGRLPGLTGELFGFRYRKKVVDHLVGLGPVAGEVKGDAHAGQIRDIRIDFVHAPVGLFPLFIPLGHLVFQPDGAFGPRGDDGADTGRVQGVPQHILGDVSGRLEKTDFLFVIFYKLTDEIHSGSHLLPFA